MISNTDSSWQRLADELDRWAATGRTATLWWRDDDATTPTPALDRLLRLSAAKAAPVALAVIPAAAAPALAAELRRWPLASALQHGLAHTDHAAPGAKKSELGADRSPDAVLADLAEGQRLLSDFAPLPILVPPWNRIAPAVVERLPAAGFTGLSTFRSRPHPHPVPGLTQVNTHLDIIAWHAGRTFVGTPAAIDAAITHLAARRTGAADPDEATGLLTHHRDHDADAWAFLDRFLTVTSAHPAVRWLDAATLFTARS